MSLTLCSAGSDPGRLPEPPGRCHRHRSGASPPLAALTSLDLAAIGWAGASSEPLEGALTPAALPLRKLQAAASAQGGGQASANAFAQVSATRMQIILLPLSQLLSNCWPGENEHCFFGIEILTLQPSVFLRVQAVAQGLVNACNQCPQNVATALACESLTG